MHAEKIVRGAILMEIASSLLSKIRAHGATSVIQPGEDLYRTQFVRKYISKELLALWRPDIDVDAMSVEIVTSLDHEGEVHYHDDAHAFVAILGPDEGVPPTGGFYAFGSKKWQPAMPGIMLEIKPKTLHGFWSPPNVEPVTFLSIQSNRIEHDFHVVP